MSKKAILVASFGTTHDDTRQSCIEAVEKRVAQAYPDMVLARAFTSGMVRRALEKRGIAVPSPTEALADLAGQGVGEVYVLPTHVMAGHEYEKIEADCRAATGQFGLVRVAPPLLQTDEDIEAVLEVVLAEVAPGPGEGLVLMGHGTDHPAGAIYTRMNEVIAEKRLGDICVATVEGEPGLGEALADMRARGLAKVVLAPLMFVAGDHAKNDMAGEEDSWLTAFAGEGFAVRAVLRGLGEYPGVQRLYLRRLAGILPG